MAALGPTARPALRYLNRATFRDTLREYQPSGSPLRLRSTRRNIGWSRVLRQGALDRGPRQLTPEPLLNDPSDLADVEPFRVLEEHGLDRPQDLALRRSPNVPGSLSSGRPGRDRMAESRQRGGQARVREKSGELRLAVGAAGPRPMSCPGLGRPSRDGPRTTSDSQRSAQPPAQAGAPRAVPLASATRSVRGALLA